MMSKGRSCTEYKWYGKKRHVFQEVMGTDNFASHHSVSAPAINKFVFLPGCHSLDSSITLLPKFKKIYNFRGKERLSETLTAKKYDCCVMIILYPNNIWITVHRCIKITLLCMKNNYYTLNQWPIIRHIFSWIEKYQLFFTYIVLLFGNNLYCPSDGTV